ncbi:hypothetical protein NKG05_22625 [Oerskovia sp. M15]
MANDASAAALEATLGGLALRFEGRASIALAGAPAPATLDDVPVGMLATLEARAGSVLRLGFPARYADLRGRAGGFDAPLVLGSRSSDVLAGLGLPPLRVGTA